MNIKETTKKKIKVNPNFVKAHAHVKASFNNTIVTITDLKGNVITWSSSGAAGFKNARKSTPHSAKIAAEAVAKKALEYGVRQLKVFAKGAGPGRDQAITALQSAGINIYDIIDVTPIPHNGCRPPKKPRK